MGLIVDDVELAIQELAIDNIVSSKWHNDDQYKTLECDRLVCLLIPAVNKLSQRVKDLESTVNGSAS